MILTKQRASAKRKMEENAEKMCDASQWNMWEINTGKCNVCDPFNKLTFTDFCHAVHQTKRTRS